LEYSRKRAGCVSLFVHVPPFARIDRATQLGFARDVVETLAAQLARHRQQ
jgi:hypothetical protein